MKPSRNRVTVNEIQVVWALERGVDDLLEEERRIVRDAFHSAARSRPFTVISCEVAARWLDARITFEAALDLPTAIKNMKAVVSRRLGQADKGRVHAFSAGYLTQTIGSPVAGEDAARSILGEEPVPNR